ncbi:MAG: DUF2079 domain-containing protein [Polyangiales bacterium]
MPAAHTAPASSSPRPFSAVHAALWSLLTFAIGWLPGVSAWRWLHGPALAVSSTDLKTKLDQAQRMEALLWGLRSLGVVVALYLLAYLWKRRRDPTLGVAAHLRGLNQKFLVLLAAPAIAALFTTHFEARYEFINMFLVAIAAATFCAWGYFILSRRQATVTMPSRDPWAAPVSSALPWVVVLTMFVAYGLGMSYLSIVEHHGLRTANWDLGIYHNIVWNTAHGDFLGCSFCLAGKHYSAHFDPILWVLTPVYRLYPRAETLLVAQSFWISFAGVPLFLYAKRKLEQPWWACAIVAAYYLTPALHGANLYDFHSLVLLIPTVIFVIYFLDAGRLLGYAVSLTVLLLTREDMALLGCFIALYAWCIGYRRTAVLTVVACVAYFASVRLFVMGDIGVIMESTPKTRSFVGYYKELIPFKEEGVLGMFITALTDPILVVLVFFKEKKIIYLLKLLLPLLFLPLIGGKKRILMLYGLAFIGLATRKYVYEVHFQYSSLLIPFLVMSVADAVVLMRDSAWVQARGLNPARVQKSLLMGVVFSSVLMAAQYGAIWPNSALKGGFEKLRWTESPADAEQYEELREVVALIPPRASVSTDRRSGAHVTDRPTVYEWPKVRGVEYILLRDPTRKHRRSQRYKKLIADKKYVVHHDSSTFVLLRRVDEAEPAQDELDRAHEDPKE